MADVPAWFVSMSNRVTSWVGARIGGRGPFTHVRQDDVCGIVIDGEVRNWYLFERDAAVTFAWTDFNGDPTTVVHFSQETAEANVIAVLQEYADRWHAEALAEALA